MGLTVRQMLQDDYFANCRLLAGAGGLDKQIQGVAVLDAPDGVDFTQGREMMLSSGYVFRQNPQLFQQLVHNPNVKLTTGLGVKERYLQEGIPQVFIDFCNENDLPLIIIPPEIPWMSLMNRLNTMVMNSNIKLFNVNKTENLAFSSSGYHAQMIATLLGQIEREMHFPALLYELASGNVYKSSQNVFMPVQELELRHFWEPLPTFRQEMLCEELHMVRYRYGNDENGVPYSWITVPVTQQGETKAYFVVIESTDVIDYFDQFSIRIGFLLLRSMYEQIMVARRLGDAGFTTLVQDVLRGTLQEEEDIAKGATDVGLDVRLRFYMVVMWQNNPDWMLTSHQEQIGSVLTGCMRLESRLALVEENQAVFVLKAGEEPCRDRERIEEMFRCVEKRLAGSMPGAELTFAAADTPFAITHLKSNYRRCLQARQMGDILHPGNSFHHYTDLGIFAWLQVEQDDLCWMLEDLQRLLDAPKKQELVETLQVYLAHNLNYSLTAKAMYLHINTVRRRIQQVEDILQMDFMDPAVRLNVEVLLKFIRHMPSPEE